jgi:periplasmic protein TonB
MIPLHELRAPSVGCAWHEVAALVLDAATAVAEQPGSDLSNPATIQLADEGHVVLPPGGEEKWPVRQLARLLDMLLQDLPAPDALRAIATHHLAAAPDESSLDAFVSALSRFERPDRAAVLSQLAARAASVERSLDGATVLAQLASRVREHDRAGNDNTATAAPGGKRLRAAAITAGVVIAAAAAFGTLAYVVAPERPNGADHQPVVARVRAGAGHLVEAARQVLRPTPPPEPAPAPAPTLVPAAPVQARRATAKPASRPVPPQDDVVSLATLERPELAAEPAADTGPVPAPSDSAVYTSADADVTPAALLRPHLPSQAPISVLPDDVGTLELTVTETGTVAHVKLISASSRYQERMLVAAAKTWRFQPAMKNGSPVRFRTRVRITV